jgi:hypothetical protein
MIDEWDRTWKEAVPADYKLLLRNFSEEMRKTTDPSAGSRPAGCKAGVATPRPRPSVVFNRQTFKR